MTTQPSYAVASLSFLRRVLVAFVFYNCAPFSRFLEELPSESVTVCTCWGARALRNVVLRHATPHRGPYLKCNPRGDVTNTSEPYDNFLCDYACLDPPCPPLVHNSSEACSCPGTHREHETVGREHNPLGGVPVPMSLRPTIPPLPSGYLNCTETVVKYECDYAASVDECVACIGRHNVTLRACRDDASVQGAACLVDKTNYTECIHAVETLTSCTRPTDVASYRECFACAYRALGTSTEWRDSHCPFLAIEDFCLSGMSEWWPYKPLLLEGDWYSLPAEGECRAEPEAAIAAGKQEKGCSWTASLVKFVNETCITDRVDKAVMSRNSACFDGCPDTDAVCWQECYFTGLAGNATAGLEPMTADTLQQLWLSSFQAESDGGCPTLIPPHQTGE